MPSASKNSPLSAPELAGTACLESYLPHKHLYIKQKDKHMFYNI